MSKVRVGIIFGGRSAEHEVSLQSARNIVDALDRTRFEPVLIGIDKAGHWHLNDTSNFLINQENPALIALNQSNRELAVVPGKASQQLVDEWQAWLVMALVVSILVYDWSHKRSSWAVIPMGLCRVFLGWAAASMAGSWWPPDSGVVLWLSALFAYIMGLTLVARGEAVGGRVPWSGLVLVMMPLVGTWWFNRLERADFRDFLFAAFLFGLGAAHVWGRLTHRADPGRVGAAVAKMLAGIVVVDALFIAQLKLEWAAGWAVLRVAAGGAVG